MTSPSFTRDERGLQVGVNYVFTPDGRVDWRAMVDRRYLYIASEYEERVVAEQGVPLAQVDISKVKDEWLRIRIGGINQLANLRGYTELEYPVFLSREGNSSCVCRMKFIGNFESNMEPVVCSGTASACRGSMDKRMLPYLETFAENRAFARCVKRALQINVLWDGEIGGDGRDAHEDDKVSEAASEAAGGLEPLHRLQELCRKSKPPITFEQLKEGAVKYQHELKTKVIDWTGWESLKDAHTDAWVLAGKILEAAKKGK